MGKTFRGKNVDKKNIDKNKKNILEHVNYFDDEGAMNDYGLYNGEIHGVYKVSYPNGERSELTYEYGIPVGSYIKYYINKQKQIETPYINGKIEGLCQEWYESGKIKIEYECSGDMKNGTYKEYYENGNLKLLCNFVDDLEEGFETEFNEDGSIKNKTYYEDGEELK